MRRRNHKARPWSVRVSAFLGPVFVFHVIALSLVCFRAQTLPDIGYFFGNLTVGLRAPADAVAQIFYSYGRGRCTYVFAAVVCFVIFEILMYLRAHAWAPLVRFPRFGRWPRAVRWAVYYVALLSVGIASQQSARFIYVQF
jgi:type II secretory pathway component PulF